MTSAEKPFQIPDEPPCSKVLPLEAAQQVRGRLRKQGKIMVFTNGCFDLLHPGHTRYLWEARKLGDFLLVALNSDHSVRTLKGPQRPILPQEARAEVLASLACVDAVLIFEEDNPLKIIQVLVPDILVKGGDWAENHIIGSDVVRQAGGQVKRIPFVPGFSTSSIIDRILGLNG